MKEVRRDMPETNVQNVILLTIIAIATMVVVVIGATFAYLSNTIQNENDSTVKAQTSGESDILLITTGNDINLNATMDNFNNVTKEDAISETLASITLQSKTLASYNYNVSLEVLENDFSYTSGTCYVKTQLIEDVFNKDDCDGIWALTSDDKNGRCYSSENIQSLDDEFYNNSIGCLTVESNMWQTNEVPELVMDFYSVDPSKTILDCENYGVCVDSKHNIAEDVSFNECVNDYTWITNKYDAKENSCFKLTSSKDLTNAMPGRYDLLSNASISVNNSAITNHYKLVATLYNMDHNQIDNINKHFESNLKIERVTE